MELTTYEKLLRASFRFVSYRPRSEKEIRDFLKKKLGQWKTAATATIPKVLDRLRDYGYIDDKRFAQWWIDQRRSFRPKGARAIGQELAAKGIDRSLVTSLVSEASKTEVGDAQTLIAKKWKTWSKLPKLEQKKKIWNYLHGRGFSARTIGSIVDSETDNEL